MFLDAFCTICTTGLSCVRSMGNALFSELNDQMWNMASAPEALSTKWDRLASKDIQAYLDEHEDAHALVLDEIGRTATEHDPVRLVFMFPSMRMRRMAIVDVLGPHPQMTEPDKSLGASEVQMLIDDYHLCEIVSQIDRSSVYPNSNWCGSHSNTYEFRGVMNCLHRNLHERVTAKAWRVYRSLVVARQDVDRYRNVDLWSIVRDADKMATCVAEGGYIYMFENKTWNGLPQLILPISVCNYASVLNDTDTGTCNDSSVREDELYYLYLAITFDSRGDPTKLFANLVHDDRDAFEKMAWGHVVRGIHPYIVSDIFHRATRDRVDLIIDAIHLRKKRENTLRGASKDVQVVICATKKEKWNEVHRDIMAKTWHPSRFQTWCLSEQEKRELEEDLVYN